MVDYAKLAAALGVNATPGAGAGLSQLIAGARGGRGRTGSSSLQDFLEQMRQRDAAVQVTPPKQAPGTKNIGESLLNLLALGSAPAAAQGQAAADELGRLARIKGNMATGEDQEWMRDATRKMREGGPFGLLQVLGDTAARIGQSSVEGVGKTLDAINPWGATPSSEIPMWSKNLEKFETAAANAEGRDPDPNDVANAVGGIALDIALDPTTYLTLGLGGAIKGAARGAARAGGRELVDGIATGPARAVAYGDEAAQLGVPEGSALLNRLATPADRLAGASRGAKAGFKDEAGRFWMGDIAESVKARKAAKAAGRELGVDGLAPATAGGKAARTIADQQEAARVVDETLTPEARAAAEGGEALEVSADSAEHLGKLAADAAKVGDEAVAREGAGLAEDLLGSVSGAAVRPIREEASAAWQGALARSVANYARTTQEAIRSVKPFEAKPTVVPLSSVGAAGEKAPMGGIVSFWKQVSSGKPLSKPRAALKPQLDQVAKVRIPLAKLDEIAPNLAVVVRGLPAAGRKRAASGTTRTTVDAREILDLLASDRLTKAVRALERGGKQVAQEGSELARRIQELTGGRAEGNLELLRAADAEARQLVGQLVERVSARATRGASVLTPEVQRAEWANRLTKILARTRAPGSDVEWATRTADELSRITDPAELGARLDAIASAVHLAAHRGPKDFFRYLEQTPARQVLEQVDAAAIRDFARLLGLPVKGNRMTVLKGLRENGYVAYKEAMEAEKVAARAFGEAQVAGHEQITAGVRALGNDVQAVKANLAAEADAAFKGLDPDDADAVVASVGAALRRNLAGRLKDMQRSLAGEHYVKTILDEGTPDAREVTLIQRVEDQTQYQAFAGLARHFAAKADAEGLTGTARAAYLDERMMTALAAQDAYLRARGMPPTSRMQDAEKRFRLGGKPGLRHVNEVAFLSLRDVLEEIPEDLRRALLYGGARASVPPTILHMLGRWAIRDFEAPTAEMAQRIAEHRNAYIQHAWKQMGGKTLFNDANRFGALADQLLTDPEVVARLQAKNIRNAIIARGVWADTAASATLPVREAFRKAMLSPALPAGAKIDQLLEFDANIAKAIDQAGISDELVQSMAHLDASVVAGQLVGPDLFYGARRSATARSYENVTDTGHVMSDEDVIAYREQFADENVAAAAKRAGKPGGTKRLKETLRTQKARQGEAVSGERLLRDAEPEIQEMTDAAVAAMREAGQEVGALDVKAARADAQFQFGFQSRFLQGFLTRFKKEYGADRAGYLRVLAQFSPVQMTARYNQGLRKLTEKWGQSSPVLVSAFKLLQKVDAIPGGTKAMADYIDAVKGAVGRNVAQDAQNAAQEARTALVAILRQAGGSDAGDDVLDAATDLWPFVSEVFDSGPHGLFARAGNSADDLNGILKAFQHKDPDGNPLELYGGFHFTRNGAAGDLGPSWRMIGAGGEQVDPVEILRSTHAAMQHATVAPTVAAGFSREFGHEAFGLTREEALAKGWKRPYKESDVGRRPFVKHLDPTQLYEPEMISELKYLDDLLQGVRKPGPALQKLFSIIDPIVQTMKSTITIWRPGHWMTNIQGEAWMNLFAGVTNPARYADAMGLMARNHRMVKPQMTFMDDYFARNAPAGMTPKPIDLDAPGVELNIGGKLQRYPDDLVYRGFEQRGIVLSHVQADDVAFDATEKAMRIGQKKPFQGVRDMNEALGRGSIARDSVFRVAHALDVMRKGKFRSLDEALDAAARDVHKWHPSYQTLTPFDQVYTRRVLYFYTWMRQAVSRMVELSLNQPSLAVLPSRVMYAIAYANGLDPQSVGSPISQDLALPDYLAHSLTGSAFEFNDRVYGMSMNAPTTDIFNQLLSPLDVDPTLSAPDNFANAAGNWTERNVGQMMSPALSLPWTLATNQNTRGQDFEAEGGATARLQNIIDTTGLGYPSRIFGQVLPGVPRSDQRTDPTDQAEKQALAAINWLTGMKFTAQSAQNVQNSADRDERDRFNRWLQMQSSEASGQ